MTRSRLVLVVGLVCLAAGAALIGVTFATSSSEDAGGGQVAASTSAPPSSMVAGPVVTQDPGDADTATTTPEYPTSPGNTTVEPPAPEPAGPGTTVPTLTIPTAPVGSLTDRLAAAAASVGFTILGLKDEEWELAAVDTQTQAGEKFVAVAYERDADYITISQERLATGPPLAEATPVVIRGIPGELIEMSPVVLLRWEEGGVSVLVSTDLTKDQALALAEKLQPVP